MAEVVNRTTDTMGNSYSNKYVKKKKENWNKQ